MERGSAVGFRYWNLKAVRARKRKIKRGTRKCTRVLLCRRALSSWRPGGLGSYTCLSPLLLLRLILFCSCSCGLLCIALLSSWAGARRCKRHRCKERPKNAPPVSLSCSSRSSGVFLRWFCRLPSVSLAYSFSLVCFSWVCRGPCEGVPGVSWGVLGAPGVAWAASFAVLRVCFGDFPGAAHAATTSLQGAIQKCTAWLHQWGGQPRHRICRSGSLRRRTSHEFTKSMAASTTCGPFAMFGEPPEKARRGCSHRLAKLQERGRSVGLVTK